MTPVELGNTLTNELKSYLKLKGYVDSGSLYNSIKFSVVADPFELKLSSEPYIKWLDNGKFLENFFAQEKITNLLATYVIESIVI